MIGINALAVFVFAMPALLAGRQHLRLGFGACRSADRRAMSDSAMSRLAGSAIRAAGEMLAVRIVQPAVAAAQKWDTSERDRIFNGLLELSGQPGRPERPAPGGDPVAGNVRSLPVQRAARCAERHRRAG